MRLVFIVWCVGIAALIGLLSPGAWRWGALLPLAALVAILTVMGPPRGAHADRAGLATAPAGHGSSQHRRGLAGGARTSKHSKAAKRGDQEARPAADAHGAALRAG